MSALHVTVEEFTSPALVTAKPDDTLDNLMTLMEREGVRHLPILDGSKAVGIISEGDLRVALCVDRDKKKHAKDIMVSDPFSVSMAAPIEDVVFELSKRKIGSALVEDEKGELYGIFTSIDALNALIEIVREVEKRAL